MEHWNQEIPSHNYQSQVGGKAAEKKLESKQVKKAGNAMFLARNNTFHFQSPTTHFKCTLLSKERGFSDSTAEGQPIISLPPTSDTCQRDTGIPRIGTLHHTTEYFILI